MSRKNKLIPPEGTRETRVFNFAMRAENDEKHGDHITGRPIVYDTPTEIHTWAGDYTEIIDRGALDSADLTDICLFVNHDSMMIPLARSRNNNENSTLQFTVGDEGMDIRSDLDTARNATASELYSAVDRGDMTGMSFAFIVSEQRWERLDTDHPVRHITAISHVLEVSVVTWPAYQSTSIDARDEFRALDSAGAALESAKKAYNTETRSKQIEFLKLLMEV